MEASQHNISSMSTKQGPMVGSESLKACLRPVKVEGLAIEPLRAGGHMLKYTATYATVEA